MNVSEIMSEGPVCIKEGDFITHARQLMRDYFLRGLVVVDEDNRLVGLLTDQDIMRVTSTRSNVTVRGYARKCPTVTPDMGILKAAKLILEFKENRVPVVMSTTDRSVLGVLSDVDILRNMKFPEGESITVAEIMTTKVETCSPEERVARVWGRMLEKNYTGVPVVSGKMEPIGMITRRDIIKSGIARMGLEDARAIRSNESPKVEKIMSTPAYTLQEQSSVFDALKLITQRDVGRITIVTEQGKVCGIVDRQDLLWTFIKRRNE